MRIEIGFKSVPVYCCVLLIAFLAYAGTGLSTHAEAAKYAGIVMDAKSGKVLYGHRADARQYPASLTKMMTLYLMFEALEAKQIRKNTRIRFSRHAASMQPSKLGIRPGGTISVEQAILALVTKSANDVAAAVAEHLGGTESGFAAKMTAKARQLGMRSTTFRNASGLPNSSQVTTARDMARLGIALREHFPQYYAYFSTRSFKFGKKRMGNHNRLLGQVKGVDGIKTGYTRASGFNLVTSVDTGGRSIVAVVLGGKTGKSRNAQMVKLIKNHLGKATRGADRTIVAKPTNSAIAIADIKLPEKGPLPQYRNGGIDPASLRVATAHVVSASVLPTRAPDGRGQFDIASIEAKLRSLSAKAVPVAKRSRPVVVPDPVQTASVRSEPPTSHMLSYAPEPRKSRHEPARRAGWQVQISAVEEQDAAIAMLEKARKKLPSLLAAYDNYTETVEKDGVVLHRARFAGFTSKDQAWDACNKLKRKRVSCLAIKN